MKKYNVDLQISPRIRATCLPKIHDFKKWIKTTLTHNNFKIPQVEITIRLLAKRESAELNWRYRKKKGPTNILTFIYNLPPKLSLAAKLPIYGDLAICIPVVRHEAKRQHKTLKTHCAHLTIHGVLHILGHDHDNSIAAKKMEDLEIEILKKLHIANPYA